MKSNIEDQIRPELVPRERLLWSGRPRGGLRLAGQDGLLIPFSLLWCGGITLGLIRAIRAEAGFFLLLFTPFVLSDLYLLVGRFVIYARRRSKTVCALTEQRALIVSGLVHRQVLNLPLHTMSTVELQEHGDGSGTITFGAADVWSQNGHGAGSAFAVIDDAPHVDALIRQARAERQRGDDVERAGGAVADHRGGHVGPRGRGAPTGAEDGRLRGPHACSEGVGRSPGAGAQQWAGATPFALAKARHRPGPRCWRRTRPARFPLPAGRLGRLRGYAFVARRSAREQVSARGV